MSVVIAYEEAGPWRKKLTIEVPAPAVDAETGRVVKDLGKKVRLPGFRKGKVPAGLVARRFPEEVERQVAERLVPRYWRQAEAEKNLDTLSEPKIEDVQFESGAAMTFVAVVETRPEIELGDVSSFELPSASVVPTGEELEEGLADLRRHHATWVGADRAASTGDLVQGNVCDLADEDAAPQPLRMELGAKNADEELTLALTGLQAGSETTFRRKKDDGEEKEYRIEVTSVEEQELPELDDAFAQVLGLEDVATLRGKMTEQLRGAKEAQLRRDQEAALLEQLRERHPLELPPAIVEAETQQMLHEQASNLAARGMDVEKAPIDWGGLAEQMRPEAGKRVHTRLVLDAVVGKLGIKLDEEEFERVLSSIAAQQKKSSLAVRQELSQTGRLATLRADLLHQQTVRHLLGSRDTGATEE